MPKSLRLKKISQSKTQKDITQFFKTSREEVKIVVSNSSVDSTEDSMNKRKVLSPVKRDSNNDSLEDNRFTKKAKLTNVQLKELEVKDIKNDKFKTKLKMKTKSPEQKSLSADINKENTLLKTSLNEVELLTGSKKSPSKYSPNKPLLVRESDFKDNELSECEEEWNFLDEYDIHTENLDLSSLTRCEIVSSKSTLNKLELNLKNEENCQCTCYVEGFWLDTPLPPGEIISVIATKNSDGHFCVNNSGGLIILRPDHLVSSTSVVAGVYCKRKAVLQERWRGIDPANSAMTVGILIHELVQKAFTNKIVDSSKLTLEMDHVIKSSAQMLYNAGLSEVETKLNMENYILNLSNFMRMYFLDKPSNQPQQKDVWNGHIEKVLEIEENVCCPQLGLKGKIDATLQVTDRNTKGKISKTVPLELKSGKASASAEHRGQLVLYSMMLSLQRGEHPTLASQSGLLLYLKERVNVSEVSCGYPERRDLIILRNQLVQYLASGPNDVNPEEIGDIEDAANLLQQKLPEPVYNERACKSCPYLTLCSLHLWHTEGCTVTESHPLSNLRDQALSHLSMDHIKYFLQWTALLKMEEKVQMNLLPLHALWTSSVKKRSKRGTCAPNLTLKSVEESGDKYLHIFQRDLTDKDSNNSQLMGPQEGEYAVVSIDKRPHIAGGVVLLASEDKIHIALERDLSKRPQKDVLFHIDKYEWYATTVQNLTSLGVLMEDKEISEKLRRLIIDKEPPTFTEKLDRQVGRLGSKLMRSLNIQQQRAVFKALAANDYALLKGLPGTGKTQTISVLIQMLVALKQKVLVTAHTNSAVDTVLNRLPSNIRVIRLGSSSRVSSSLYERCENHLTKSCDTPEKLAQLYDSMDVVGVTCLGASHALLSKTVFDICIVDEATQVLQSTVLRPLFAAKRFVLVGDPEQLPPLVKSKAARSIGMEESLFHRLMRDDCTSTLQMQYRMNESLAEVANKVSYNGQLKCANEAVANAKLNFETEKVSNPLFLINNWVIEACNPNNEAASVFINMDVFDTKEVNDTKRKNCTNSNEVCCVMAVIECLLEGGVKEVDIGVIAPYRDQVSLIRQSIRQNNVEVSTVDQFQGKDKSVIIYSSTRKVEEIDNKNSKEGEILNDQRRLAVSVTRAKHKFILIGSLQALRHYAPLQKLIEYCHTLSIDEQGMSHVIEKYKKIIM